MYATSGAGLALQIGTALSPTLSCAGLSTFSGGVGQEPVWRADAAGMDEQPDQPPERSRRTYLTCVVLVLCCLMALVTVIVVVSIASAGPAMAARVSAGSPASRTWQWPLQPLPTVLRGFAPPAQRWESGHRGVDLAAWVGQPIHAAGSGVVSYAGMLAGRGVVAVSHGALRTTYEPIRATVRAGQRVTAGQVIGTLEDRPGHCVPRGCLHWGLLRGREYLNPLLLLRRGPSRLLPVWGASPGSMASTRGPSGAASTPPAQPGALASSRGPANRPPTRPTAETVLAGTATLGLAVGLGSLIVEKHRRGSQAERTARPPPGV